MPQSLPDLYASRARSATPGRRPEQPPRRTKRRSAVALAGVPLFAGFSKRHLGKLAEAADEVTFRPGEHIVDQGNPGETLFVVLEGQAKVVRDGKTRARLVPGDFFGEVSLLDGGPRTATVVAETPVAAVRLFRRTVMDLIQQEPQLGLHLLEGIARRLREIDRSLSR
jgi:CRP/FNR family transcriptional regulator, cyclic AMP receptor protein